MTTHTSCNKPVTTMFTDRVRPDETDDYQAWSTGIHGDIKQFPGYLGVDVIRTNESDDPEYVTLVKFDNRENLKRWKESATVAKWLDKLPDLLIGNSHKRESVGRQLWFDRPNISQRLKEPPFWKRVIIGVICVYPLILLLHLALGPVTGGFPWELALFPNVVILSALLTYPVIPWVTRLLRPWLYPKQG